MQFKLLHSLTLIYVVFQIISDVTAGKIIALGGFSISITILYFPITYIIADIITEVYGFKVARNVVWKVFFASVVAGIVFWIVSVFPPAIGFENNQAYQIVFGQVPRILVGGWIAVWCGAMINDVVLSKMKIWTKGRFLWMRTITSTIFGEGANTILFYVIALYNILPTSLLIQSILAGWFLKVILEVVLTPLTYKVIAKVKEIEKVDVYDVEVSYNPLIFK